VAAGQAFQLGVFESALGCLDDRLHFDDGGQRMELWLLDGEEVLLGAHNAAGPTDPTPGDGLGGREAIVLHEERCDGGARPSKPSFAVHGYSSRLALAHLQQEAKKR